MKINFYLRPSKNDSSIYCYIREFKQTITLNTGERVKKELWDENLQRANPRKTRDNITKKSLKDLNQFLDAFENKIWEIERTVRRKKFNASFSILSDEIKKHFTKKKDEFLDIYDEFLMIKRQEVTKPSILKLKRVKALLQEYEKVNRENLDFDKIDPLFFSKFNSFLIEKKGMLNNTASKNIQFLKTFLIWANNNGYTSNTSYKSFKGKSEACLLYTSPSPRDRTRSRMPSSA